MNSFLAFIGAGLVGVCIALEPAVNSGLGKILGMRLAAFHSFFIGFILLMVTNLLLGGMKDYRLIVKAPPYLWIGGLLGAVVVYGGARVSSVIGIAVALTIMVSVQMVTGIVIDSFGLFGVKRIPVDISRIIGVLLLIIAVKLIVK